MSFIRNVFKSKKVDWSKFAQIPLKLMESKSPPFDDWQDPEVDVPEDMRKIFNFYAWLYQLYMFYMITSDSLGNDLAVKIVEQLSEAEENILGTTSFNIYENINNIHVAIHQLLENPVVEDMDGEPSEMPLEYGLAKRFLFSGEYSPLKFKEEDIDLGEVSILGLCLFHAKQPAIAYFENLVASIEIRENAQ
jgi:hypothetical protein